MSTTKKIVHNTFWQVILRGANVLLGVFSLALVTRILGQEGFGFYTTITAFVQTFMVLADLGLYLSLLRAISATTDKQEENKIVNNVFTIRLLSSIVVLLLVPLIIQFFPYDPIVKSKVIFILLAFLCQSLVSTLTAVFSKNLVMPKAAWVDVANKIFYLATLWLIFKQGPSITNVLWAQSLSAVLALVLFLLLLNKYVRLRLAWDWAYWRRVFFSAWPLAITVVLNLVYFKADTLILSAYHSAGQVGLYGAAYRVLEALAAFPHMFMSLILPLFTAAWVGKDLLRLKNIWQYTFDFFSILTIGMVVVTWLVSRPLMILIAGADFTQAGPILNILIVATMAIFFGTLFTYLVVALDLQKQMIKYFFCTAVVGLLGYFIFIPLYSYWGAAVMTVFVEALLASFAYYLVRKNLSLGLNLKVLGKSILAGAFTLLIVWWWQSLPVIILLFLASLIYLVALYVFKAINKEIIQQIFKQS